MIIQEKEKSFLDTLDNEINTVHAFHEVKWKDYYETVAAPDILPVAKLIRFFTLFGINHYIDKVDVYGKEWEEYASFKQEVTDLLPLLQGEVWIGDYIGKYDIGCHKVNFDLRNHAGSPGIPDEKEK